MMDYEDPSTPILLQLLLSLSNDIIKDSYQHLVGNMGELPDLKKRTAAAAIVQKWGERICDTPRIDTIRVVILHKPT